MLKYCTIAENKQVECEPYVQIEILLGFKQLKYFFP